MDSQAVADRVKRTFGDESGVQVTDSDIIRWMNDGMREIASANDILQTKGTIASVSGTQAYSLPADCLTLRSVWYGGVKLDMYTMAQVEEFLVTTGTAYAEGGNPQYYWIWANQLNFYPIPADSTASQITVFYTRTPIDVSILGDDLDIPVQYHNALVAYVLKQAYELDEDWTASGNKLTEFQTGLNDLKENETVGATRFYKGITTTEWDLEW